jgi:hypothetical protein
MVWVSGRKQSIPLADPLCLKEVRDSSVSSKREGSTFAVSAQTSGVGSTAGQPNHRGGFFRGTSEQKTITYPLCTCVDKDTKEIVLQRLDDVISAGGNIDGRIVHI